MGVRDAGITIGRCDLCGAEGRICKCQGCGKAFCAACAGAETTAEETHCPDCADRYVGAQMSVGRGPPRPLIAPDRPVKCLDPYIGCTHRCVYCFALDEPDRPAGVLLHPDLAGQLTHDLAELEPQSIYVGSLSDAYQPAEETHQQTRRALEILAARGFSAIILTKSGLVARDADLLSAMPEAAVGVSLSFQDEDVRRLFEPAAPPNAERIAALHTLRQAGVRTYALITPVMPFLTDVPALVELVAPHVDDIWVQRLGFAAEQDRSWQGLRAVLDRHFPHLTAAYREIAFAETHPYWAETRQALLATRWDRLSALGCETRLHVRL